MINTIELLVLWYNLKGSWIEKREATGVFDSFVVRLTPVSLRHRSAEEKPGSLWLSWCVARVRTIRIPPGD